MVRRHRLHNSYPDYVNAKRSVVFATANLLLFKVVTCLLKSSIRVKILALECGWNQILQLDTWNLRLGTSFPLIVGPKLLT